MISRYTFITAFVCLIVVLACDTPSNPEYGSGNPDPNPPGSPAATITAVNPSSALPGEAVTITGTGFDTEPSANLVSFGRSAATVTSATATQLEVIAPPAAGSVNVKVAVLGSVNWSNEVPFTFKSFIPVLDNPEVTKIDTSTVWPMGIAVDGDGNVYFSSADAGEVYQVTPAGDKSVFAEVPAVGAMHFGSDGYLYVCEMWDGKVVRISPDGSTVEDVAELDNPNDFDWDAAGNMYINSNEYGIYMLPAGGGDLTEVAGDIGATKCVRVFGDNLYVSKIWDGVISKFDISVGPDEILDTEETYLEDETDGVPLALEFDKNGVMYWGSAWTGALYVYAPGGSEEATFYEDEIPAQFHYITFHGQDIYMTYTNGGDVGEVIKVHIGVDQAPRY
jgi:sugar lactone lactonase YvrE